MKLLLALFLALALGGCVAIDGRTPAERAREKVIALVGTETRIEGPLASTNLSSLDSLSSSDREQVQKFLADGALAFAILVPDRSVTKYNDDGSLMEIIRVGRIIVVQQNKIAGDFPAE